VLSQSSVVFGAYVAVFAGSAVACFVSLLRVSRILEPDVRRGLAALLLLSGGWATAHVGYLVAPTPRTKVVCYVVGLTVGFAATGAWLYFCSAFTGRRLHHDRTLRILAVAVFVGVVALKATNPWHGQYFSTTAVESPFSHLAVTHHWPHFVAMGLAYALAFVGYSMLYERFTYVGQDTRPLLALLALTGLPVAVDVVGVTTPGLLDMTYEPVGVAAFAVGVLFVYVEEFQAVELASNVEEPVVVLDEDDRIREINAAATELFPALESAIGQPLEDVVPEIAERLAGEERVLAVGPEADPSYVRLSTSPFTVGETQIGRMVLIEDVTRSERYRRELEAKTERLDRFASVVSHDLRNPLTVAKGRLEMARTATAAGESPDDEDLAAAEDSLDRMEALIADLLELARQGRDIDDLEDVDLGAVARDAWRVVETDGAGFTAESAPTVRADRDRVRQLLENLFRNAIEHGGTDVSARVGPIDGGFFVEDDGTGIPVEDREAVFETGHTTAPDGTGFGLAIVTEIAEAHGWSVVATESEAGGARFEITGVAVVD